MALVLGDSIDRRADIFAFSAGLVATLGVVFFKELVSKGMRYVFKYVEPIGNLAMVGTGGYLIYYWTLGTGSELLALRADQLF